MSWTRNETPVAIPVADGALSGVLCDVDAAPLATVVCHPHPAYGGNMHNNVVLALRQGFVAAGAVLRFDFRGIGASDGTSCGDDAEVDDVLAAVAWLRARYPQAKLCLAGYSFGAVMARRASLRTAVDGLLLVAPPPTLLAPDELHGLDATARIVAGDADVFCPLSVLRRRLDDPSRLQVLAGADHFFGGCETELEAISRRHAAEIVGAAG